MIILLSCFRKENTLIIFYLQFNILGTSQSKPKMIKRPHYVVLATVLVCEHKNASL